MIAYFNEKYLPVEEIKISPFDRGYQFSDGVYEVIRYYPEKFFEFRAHIERLKYSLSQLQITYAGLGEIESILLELISKNNLRDKESIAYIQITRGVQIPRRHNFAARLYPTVFMYTEEFPAKIEAMEKGVPAGLEEDLRWLRCDIKSISLLAGIMTKQRGAQNGFYEIIQHRNGLVTEGTHTNVAFVKDGCVITSPLSNLILSGITRKVMLNICNEMSIPFQERNIHINEISGMEECFLTGTTTEVTPVVKISDAPMGTGTPGKVTRLLQEGFKKRIKQAISGNRA